MDKMKRETQGKGKVPWNVKRKDAEEGRDARAERLRLRVTFALALEAAAGARSVPEAIERVAQWGVEELREDRRGRSIDPETVAEVRRLLGLGWATSTVARKLKLSRARVGKIAHSIES